MQFRHHLHHFSVSFLTIFCTYWFTTRFQRELVSTFIYHMYQLVPIYANPFDLHFFIPYHSHQQQEILLENHFPDPVWFEHHLIPSYSLQQARALLYESWIAVICKAVPLMARSLFNSLWIVSGLVNDSRLSPKCSASDKLSTKLPFERLVQQCSTTT